MELLPRINSGGTSGPATQTVAGSGTFTTTGPATQTVAGSGTFTVSGTISAVPTAATTGGATPYRNLDLGLTGQVVKNSAGQLYGGVISNQNTSSARYLKIYDKASAPTSSDTPVFTIPLPTGIATGLPSWMIGINFVNGISLRATGGIADADTTAPSTNDVVVNLLYK